MLHTLTQVRADGAKYNPHTSLILPPFVPSLFPLFCFLHRPVASFSVLLFNMRPSNLLLLYPLNNPVVGSWLHRRCLIILILMKDGYIVVALVLIRERVGFTAGENST